MKKIIDETMLVSLSFSVTDSELLFSISSLTTFSISPLLDLLDESAAVSERELHACSCPVLICAPSDICAP